MNNSQISPIRVILAILLGPIGVMGVLFVGGLLSCGLSLEATACERLPFALAAGAWLFPLCWIIEFTLGAPIFFCLYYFQRLNLAGIVSGGMLVGLIVMVPGAVRVFREGTQGNLVLSAMLGYGALCGAAVGFVIWLVAFRQRGSAPSKLQSI